MFLSPRKYCGLQLLDAARMFVKLHLDNLIETTNDRGKAFVHLAFNTVDSLSEPLFESPHLRAQSRARVVAFFLDKPRKFFESVCLFLRHIEATIPHHAKIRIEKIKPMKLQNTGLSIRQLLT